MQEPELVLSFARLRAYLAAAGCSMTVSPGGDMLQLAFEAPTGMSYVAMREVSGNAGSAWLAMSVPLGASEEFSVRAALAANDDVLIGMLGDYEGVMLLRQTLPLRSLSFPRFESVLGALVQTAGQIAARAPAFQYLRPGAP